MTDTNDVRERMQECARMVEVILPPNTGFILLAFDFGVANHVEYVSNARRKDVVATLCDFAKNCTDERRWKKVER